MLARRQDMDTLIEDSSKAGALTGQSSTIVETMKGMRQFAQTVPFDQAELLPM